MIVLEGPDNGGKSTLAGMIGAALGIPVQGSEGPPKYEGEMNQRIREYLDRPTPYVFDRFPAISNPIYDRALSRRPDVIDPALISQLYARQPLFIYCDPIDRGLAGHVVKERESTEHIEGVGRNHRHLVDLYEAWARRHATMWYRIGDNLDVFIPRVIRAASNDVKVTDAPDLFGDIAAFHEKFKLEYHGDPRDLPSDLLSFRVDFLVEELIEYVFPKAGNVGLDTLRKDFKSIVSGNMTAVDTQAGLAKRFDALIDLVYVALGTAYLHGFPFNEGWRRVQAANMAKVRALRGEDSTRGSTYDVIKPAGWTAPVLDDLVSA